jgi:hypothetical protein
VDNNELNDLRERHSELDRAFTEYRISMSEWHAKTRADIDHILQGCQARKKDCGQCLTKKVGKLTDEVVKLKVLMARHATWIAIVVVVVSVVISAAIRKLL